ncbi:uncharacterized protein LOC128869847 [Anastrepha ludens]|uniref:uncharacterized protein LOC128869847 n=1 Tax=Anastrepha ludens TaxID=28586 RepID=UPI0023B0672B|nr:uncharacterized protein LOC128869847 [Anastrepha ludens]
MSINWWSNGPFSKHQLTQTEESIVIICAIAKSVEGVAGNSLGLPNESDDEMSSTSSTLPKRQMSPLNTTPKRQRKESTGESLKKFLDEDNEIKLEINEKLDDLIQIRKGDCQQPLYRAIETTNKSVANAVTQLKDEFVRINKGKEKAATGAGASKI